MKKTITTEMLLQSLTQFLQLKDEKYSGEIKKELENKGLEGYSLSELHVIQCIGEDNMRNLTAISDFMSMTRGAVSKICTRLQTKNAVEKMKMADNQKEIFFVLTEEGSRLFQLHAQLHQQSKMQWLELLEKYNSEEKQLINRFLEDVIAHLQMKQDG